MGLGIDFKEEIIEEPNKHFFDFQKCLVVIISITPSRLNIERQDFTEIPLPEDLADLSDFIEILESSQFNVPAKSIVKFINPENAEEVKASIAHQLTETNIENVLVFYQGFGHKDLQKSGLYLLLTDTFKNTPGSYLTMHDFTDLFEAHYHMNVIFFLDCSFSALAFDYLKKENCVIIASSGHDEYAYFANDSKRRSIFSSSLIQVIREGVNNNRDFISLSDLFLQLRFEVIKQMRIIRQGEILQIPRINSRDLTQYFRFIKNNFNLRDKAADGNTTAPLTYEAIRIHLEEGNIREALAKMKRLSKSLHLEDQNELSLHFGNYSNLERSWRIDILDFEDYNLARNRITHKLLAFTEQIRYALS